MLGGMHGRSNATRLLPRAARHRPSRVTNRSFTSERKEAISPPRLVLTEAISRPMLVASLVFTDSILLLSSVLTDSISPPSSVRSAAISLPKADRASRTSSSWPDDRRRG